MTYGSYLAKNQSIVKASAIIVVLDTLIALVATVIMFSVIFSVPGMNEQVSGTGAVGMLFIALPQLFFTEVPFGSFLGPLFYVLVAIAALTRMMAMKTARILVFFSNLLVRWLCPYGGRRMRKDITRYSMRSCACVIPTGLPMWEINGRRLQK